MNMERTFRSIVVDQLSHTPIAKLLSASSAVVLERLAYGGGSTNWFYCENQRSLQKIEAALSPSSRACFYFDGRIRSGIFSELSVAAIRGVLEATGEILVGTLEPDGYRIEMIILNGLEELSEHTPRLAAASMIFYGVFPTPDNDGVHAVTLDIADQDGIVTSHPH